jgi:hypothetical protein
MEGTGATWTAVGKMDSVSGKIFSLVNGSSKNE